MNRRIKWRAQGLFLALAFFTSVGMADVVPIDSITTDNPAGSPPYNILSITIGGYTVLAERLATGTTTFGSIGGTEAPEMDDFDINTAINYNLGQTPWYTVDFGGGLWKDSNGDNPDFILFESGGNGGDDPIFQAVFPDGSVGQTVQFPAEWGGTGYNRDAAIANDAVDMNGQQLHGLAFSITDLLDASGDALAANTVIRGFQFERSGTDPVGLFAVMPAKVLATNPNPQDGGVDVIRDGALTWEPSRTAATHTVYLSHVFEDVNDRRPGALVAENLDVNELVLDQRLDFGETYFWAVDEVNGAPDYTVFPGEVWQFEAEPYAISIPGDVISVSASSESENGLSTAEKLIDGSGLDEDGVLSVQPETMWFSATPDVDPWIQFDFDGIKKLDSVKVWNANGLAESSVGWGIKAVEIVYSEDGENWTVLEDANEFRQAPGIWDYDQFDEVFFDGAPATHVRFNIKSNWGGLLPAYGLSEVQFNMIPTVPRTPAPVSGATDIRPDAVVTWRAGREADQHRIYISTDATAVADGSAPAVDVSANNLDLALAGINMGETYYWRVEEVNDAESPSVWAGPVWDFSTVGSLIVDDFEGYGNISPDRPFQTWLDGFGYSEDDFFPAGYGGNGSGLGVGHDIWSVSSPYYNGSIMEQNITIAGSSQSMPLYYTNGGITDRKWAAPQNWAVGGAQTMVLHFFGDSGNTGQLYVQVNSGPKVNYEGPANAISTPYWTQWNIDLASLGTTLESVTQLSIGVQGGSGVVYIDDIRLYREPPSAASEMIWIEAESPASMSDPMQIYTDEADASGGSHIGTENLGNVGDRSEGIATYSFTVDGGTYSIQGRVIEPDAAGGANSFWVRLSSATLNTTPLPENDGWMNWNFTPSATWIWEDMVNTNDGNIPIEFTLAPGSHTLEVAYREDGALLDAMVITNQP